MAEQVVTTIEGYQEYPKWKYKGAKGVLVNSAAEEKALGKGYADAPTEEAPAPEVDPRDAEIEALKAQLAAAQAANKPLV